jgi:sigma-B regulation protein RsbU (phosphoserine phosphatase)
VFFSDGILDARNLAGEMPGRRWVEDIVAKSCTLTAQAVVDTLFTAVDEHSAGVETFDDQTIVAIKVQGIPGKRA